MSYANMILYGAVIPGYKKPDKDGKRSGKHERLSGDDPHNRDKVKQLLFG